MIIFCFSNLWGLIHNSASPTLAGSNATFKHTHLKKQDQTYTEGSYRCHLALGTTEIGNKTLCFILVSIKVQRDQLLRIEFFFLDKEFECKILVKYPQAILLSFVIFSANNSLKITKVCFRGDGCTNESGSISF